MNRRQLLQLGALAAAAPLTMRAGGRCEKAEPDQTGCTDPPPAPPDFRAGGGWYSSPIVTVVAISRANGTITVKYSRDGETWEPGDFEFTTAAPRFASR